MGRNPTHSNIIPIILAPLGENNVQCPGGGHREAELLANAYENAFRRARETGHVRTIAFPAISTGVYGFPKADAARIALTTRAVSQLRKYLA